VDWNKVTHGVRTAAARCEIPESFPTKTRAPLSTHASSNKSSVRAAPSRSSSGPQNHLTGMVRESFSAIDSNIPIGARLASLLANG
jgi:hypothetical protein